jgi:hypothetical protein
MTERLLIDTRDAEAPLKEVTQDLIIEVDLYDDGYTVSYKHKSVKEYIPYNTFQSLDRRGMVEKHVHVIRALAPRTAVVITGKYSTGYEKHVLLHPGVLMQIIDMKLGVDELLLQP